MRTWPQIVFIVMYSLNLMLALIDHGKPRRGINSFWLSLLTIIISIILLWFGGFWDVWK